MDSAKTLKKALHSIFELEVYENALKDIGTIKNAQSALGQLHRKKLDAFEKVTKEKKAKDYIREIRILEDKIEELEEKLDKCK